MFLSDGFPSLHTGLLPQLRTSVVTTESWPLSQGTRIAFSRFRAFFQMSLHLLLRCQHRREETRGSVGPSVLRRLKLEQVPMLYSLGALEASSQVLGRGTFLHWGKDKNPEGCPQRVNIPNRLLLDFCI